MYYHVLSHTVAHAFFLRGKSVFYYQLEVSNVYKDIVFLNVRFVSA